MTTKERKKKIKSKLGDIFQVPLGDGSCAFGLLAKDHDGVFFNFRSNVIPATNELLEKPVLFRVCIGGELIESGAWPIIDSIELTGEFAQSASYRNQPVGSNQLYLYRAGVTSPATLEEVGHLELTAAWDGRSVLNRLLNYFAGKPDPTTEYFKKIHRYDPVSGQEIND